MADLHESSEQSLETAIGGGCGYAVLCMGLCNTRAKSSCQESELHSWDQNLIQHQGCVAAPLILIQVSNLGSGMPGELQPMPGHMGMYCQLCSLNYLLSAPSTGWSGENILPAPTGGTGTYL